MPINGAVEGGGGEREGLKELGTIFERESSHAMTRKHRGQGVRVANRDEPRTAREEKHTHDGRFEPTHAPNAMIDKGLVCSR